MKEQARTRGVADTKWRRRIGRCGAVQDVVCRGMAMPRCRPASLGTARCGAARRDAARCATPWCCWLTYLSAAAPPATGSAASVQSGVLPICIPDSPPGQSNDSPVYPFLALSRFSLLPSSPTLSHLSFISSFLLFCCAFYLRARYHCSLFAKATEGCSF